MKKVQLLFACCLIFLMGHNSNAQQYRLTFGHIVVTEIRPNLAKIEIDMVGPTANKCEMVELILTGERMKTPSGEPAIKITIKNTGPRYTATFPIAFPTGSANDNIIEIEGTAKNFNPKDKLKGSTARHGKIWRNSYTNVIK